MTTNKPEVVAYATHHDEPMLFPSKREAAMHCGDGEEPLALIHIGDYEALATECEKLRKDAERYRWLRDSDDYELCAVRIDYWCDEYIGQAACEVLGGDYLDRDIDAAMAQQEPSNGKREDEK